MFEVRSSSPESTINHQTSCFHRGTGQEIVRVPTQGRPIEELLTKEWLLTNERGSFASSTIAGCNISGYHGLLVGSPDPLVRRILTLSNCLEAILWDGQRIELSTFEFPDRFVPQGYTYLYEFRRDLGAHFQFHTEPVDVCKSVYLARDTDTVLVEYTFDEVRAPVELVLRPLLAMRDFHTLQRAGAPLACRIGTGAIRVRSDLLADCALHVGCSALEFEADPQWWYNFVYRTNDSRGLPAAEDLWAPGCFRGWIDRPGRIVFWAHLGAELNSGSDPELSPAPHGQDARATFHTRFESQVAVPPLDAEAIKEDLRAHQERLIERAGARDKTHRTLCLAADQFVAKRRSRGGERTTVVAGFPWFADWGRDTFLSLPGLLLATGRHEEAGSVLCTFAAALDEGMIPNRFDDRTGEAHYNSVDASLWFIHAAFEYWTATGNTEEFSQRLFPAVRTILDAYHAGTRYGIRADCDGLITAGDRCTQLTWMDAQCDGVVFTPRCGKAVEVNALWHNALRRTQRFCESHVEGVARDTWAAAARYAAWAEQAGRSFCRVFWNAELGHLNDTIRPDGTADASLRPNQIFAVALPFGPPLTLPQQQAVVNAVRQQLLTPYGPRTLWGRDPAYQGRYEGPLGQRDAAYHQGTVWPYLMGPFLEAYLKVHGYSAQSKSEAAELLRPLLHHLTADGCLGSICEVFDGDPVHRPGGCLAQAWSVAEILRIYRRIV